MAGSKRKNEGDALHWLARMVTVSTLVCAMHLSAFGLPDNLSGNIQLTGVNTDIDGGKRESFDQRYYVNWYRGFTDYTQLRAGLSYDRYGLDLGEGGNIWRKQIRPVAEFQWGHPLFRLLVSASRREATSDDRNTDLIRNGVQVNLASRLEKYPDLSLRYGFDEAYNKHDRGLRDTREHLFQGTISRTMPHTTVNYSLTHREFDNITYRLSTSETSHRFRWLQTNQAFHERLNLTADYSFNYRTQTDRLIDVDTTVRPIDYLTPLYAQDATPELGELDTLAALADGNVDDPTDPVIDIGRGITDQNIGADFGYDRPVRGIYIYTDVPSGSGLVWRVYTSEDNVEWTQLPTPLTVTYNSSFRRYEILFDEIRTRYIKATNLGTNDVLTVRVTEIEPLEGVARNRETSRSQTVHNVDLGARYHVNPKLQAAAGLNYRREPSGDFGGSRNLLYYDVSMTHQPSEMIMQTARWTSGWDDFQVSREKDWVNTLTYTLQVRPMSTLQLLLSGLSRNNRLGGTPFEETNNITGQVKATLIRYVDVRLDGGYSRNNQYIAQRKFDTWTFRSNVQAALTGALDVDLSTLYQTTTEPKSDFRRIYRTYTGTADWNVTPTIVFRGSATWGLDENREYLSQSYSLSWLLTPNLSASSVISIIDSDVSARLEQSHVRINYQLSRRTSLYAAYLNTTTKDGGTRAIDAIQLGFRTGF
jgi:hypothetical protein